MNTGEQKSDGKAPGISHAEPVLVVTDVAATVEYWKTVLGFTYGWTYGNPINHGGVSWHGSGFIQFGHNPKLAAYSAGHSVWLNARNLTQLYELHHTNNAEIIAPLENKPWGRAEYGIRELNGYVVYFSGPVNERPDHASRSPASVRIYMRKPTESEHSEIMTSVGWQPTEIGKVIRNCVMGFVAEDTASGKIIGSVLLLGDNGGFYYVKDLAVNPKWQGKQVGTQLMKELMTWLHSNAPGGATVGLFTGDHLAEFYRQFGFIQCCGMYQQILTK